VFRDELKASLSAIFGFPKTTFNAPSTGPDGSFEQDTLFIQIDEAPFRATEGKAYCKVLGSLIVFSQLEKLPFGFFNRKIQMAPHELTEDFFFFDIDTVPANSPARIQNIAERRLRFIYLYSSQYDPAQGLITSVEGI
jgi:hypothetical protein